MVHVETETIVATAVYKFFIFQIHIDKILELSYVETIILCTRTASTKKGNTKNGYRKEMYLQVEV